MKRMAVTRGARSLFPAVAIVSVLAATGMVQAEAPLFGTRLAPVAVTTADDDHLHKRAVIVTMQWLVAHWTDQALVYGIGPFVGVPAAVRQAACVQLGVATTLPACQAASAK